MALVKDGLSVLLFVAFLASLAVVAQRFWYAAGVDVRREGFAFQGIMVGLLVLLLCSTLGLVGTLLRANGPAFYVLVAIGLLWSTSRLRSQSPVSSSKPQTVTPTRWMISCVLILFIPLIVQSVVPIGETDSLYAFNYLIPWLHNELSPLAHPLLWNGYPALWETGILPALALTGNASTVWLMSAIPVAISALALFAIGQEIGLPSWLSVLVGGDAMALRNWWIEASGVATIKNDMVLAAALLTLVLAILRWSRGRSEPATYALAAVAFSWLMAKYNGLEFAVVVCTLGLVSATVIRAYRPERVRLWWHVHRPVLVRWAAIAAVLTIPGLVYYIRNLVLLGNPVAPFTLTVLGRVIFQGTVALDPGTSLLANISSPQLWSALLPGTTLGLEGPLFFPIFLVALASGPLTLLLALLWRVQYHKAWPFERVVPLLLCGAFGGLAFWLFYFSAPFAFPYMWHLTTLRYAEGALGLIELSLAGWLILAGLPPGFVALPFAISFVWRIAILYQFWFESASHFVASSVIPVIVGLILALLYILGWLAGARGRVAVALAVAVASFAVVPLYVANTSFWAWPWGGIPQRLFFAPGGSRVLLISDGQGAQPWMFLTESLNLKNQVHIINMPAVTRGNPYTTLDVSGYHYVVRFANANVPASATLDLLLASALRKDGFKVTVAPFAVLGVAQYPGPLGDRDPAAIATVGLGPASRARR